MDAEIGFELSSGNIFEDLELENPEELNFKSSLIVDLKKILKARDITQRNAAKLLKTTQPTLSKVLRGDIDRVSVETLFSWLRVLGKRIEYRLCEADRNCHSNTWQEAR